MGRGDRHSTHDPAARRDLEHPAVGRGAGTRRGRPVGGVANHHTIGLRQGLQLDLVVVAPVVQLALHPEGGRPVLDRAHPLGSGRIEGAEPVAQARRLELGRGRHRAGGHRGLGVARLVDHGCGVEGLDLEVGATIAILLTGQFPDLHGRRRGRERTTADVGALLPPDTPADAVRLEVLQRRGLVQRPGGVHGGVALEVGPEDGLGVGGAKESPLSLGPETVVGDAGRELLRAFQGLPDGLLAVLVPGKGQVDAGGTQFGLDGRVDDLIEGLLQGGAELQGDAVPQGIQVPPLGVVRGGPLRLQVLFDALEGPGLPGGVQHLLEGVPGPAQEEHPVLELLLAPPGLPVARDGKLVRLAARPDDDQRRAVLLHLDFVRRGQHLDHLEAVPEGGREVLLQMLSEHPVHRLGMQGQGRGPELRRQVLLVLEEQPSVSRVVEIPGAGGQLVEDVSLEG